MTYFQNPFPSEFRGNWVLGDRQHSLTFICASNAGRTEDLVSSWNEPNSGIYDLSGSDADGNSTNILSIRFNINNNTFWSNMEIDLTDNTNAGLSPVPVDSEMKPFQIVSILNSDPSFSSYFEANLEKFSSGDVHRIAIKQKFSNNRMKFFIINGRAEEVLGFNARAGIAELPSYFRKYKVYGGDMSYPIDDTYALVELSPSNSGGTSIVDDNLIDSALDAKGNSLSLDSSSMKKDYEFLEGRASGLYTFQKMTLDVNDRITQIIEYPAGASVGDLARKINYTYSGTNKSPDTVTEIPYVIESSDLLSP